MAKVNLQIIRSLDSLSDLVTARERVSHCYQKMMISLNFFDLCLLSLNLTEISLFPHFIIYSIISPYSWSLVYLITCHSLSHKNSVMNQSVESRIMKHGHCFQSKESWW